MPSWGRAMSFVTKRNFISYFFSYLLACHLFSCQTTNSSDSLQSAYQAASLGLWREAIHAYHQVLSTSPRNAVAHRNLGILLVKIGEYQEGLQHLEKSQANFPKDSALAFYSGEAQRSLGLYDKAISSYQRVLSLQKHHRGALRSLCWTMLKTKQLETAGDFCSTMLEHQPLTVDDVVIYARVLLAQGKAHEALQFIAQQKKHFSSGKLSYVESVEGDVLFALHRYDEAARIYVQALRGNSLLPGPLLGLGKYYTTKGETEKAIEYLEKAVYIRPHLIEAQRLLGELLEKRNTKRAVFHYELFLQYAQREGGDTQQSALIRRKLRALKSAI